MLIYNIRIIVKLYAVISFFCAWSKSKFCVVKQFSFQMWENMSVVDFVYAMVAKLWTPQLLILEGKFVCKNRWLDNNTLQVTKYTSGTCLL